MQSHFKIDNLPNFTINCDFICKCLLLEKLDLKYAVCSAVQSIRVDSSLRFVCLLTFQTSNECISAVIYTQHTHTQYINRAKNKLDRNVWSNIVPNI